MKPSLAQSLLRELFEYRADGQLIWKVQLSSRGVIGTVAGSVGSTNLDGYRIIRVNKQPYYAHRLVWVWHFGSEPHYELDHINRDPADNRIENLRDVTKSRNQWNRKKVGYVRQNPNGGRWRAMIKAFDQAIELGHFDTEAEALQAVERARQSRELGVYNPEMKH